MSNPTIKKFNAFMSSIVTKCKDDAVIVRHIAQLTDGYLKEWKEDADTYLNNSCKECDSAEVEQDGTVYKVIRVLQNTKKYTRTAEYIAAEKAAKQAADYFAEVQAKTKFKLVKKAKGYFYKVQAINTKG